MKDAVKEKVVTLFNALSGDENIYGWIFNFSGVLVYTNCNEPYLEAGFRRNLMDVCIDYGKTHNHPLIISSELSSFYCIVFDKSEEVPSLCILGPILSTDYEDRIILERLEKHGIDVLTRTDILRVLDLLPVIPLPRIMHDTVLLHYFVTGEKIDRSLIHYHVKDEPLMEKKEEANSTRQSTYAAEKELLSMVREGNLNYKKALTNASNLSNGVRIGRDNSLNQAKISVICFTTLCTRAAMEGGLVPNSAYSLGDGYIEMMNDAKSIGELTALSHEMYNDFILHVHKTKSLKKYSAQINTVILYIEFHPKEKITLDALASLVYYNPSYLSRKFKEETSFHIHEYILKTKLKNAKNDLENGNCRIADVVRDYQFASSEHFSSAFRKEFGVLPSEYRKTK